MMTNEVKMFGMTRACADTQYARIRSFANRKESAIVSMLSDVQEMIDRGMLEESRQTLNRVKYFLLEKND